MRGSLIPSFFLFTSNHLNLQFMQTLSLDQALYCPFPARISPYADAVEQHTDQWTQAFDLHRGDSFLEYKRAAFGHMTSRFYPTANFRRLSITNDLLVLLFLLDDMLDHETAPDAPPVNFEQLARQFCNVLVHDETHTRQSGPVLAALSDVWRRMRELCNAELKGQFIQDIVLLFKAIKWQNQNTRAGIIPSLDEYSHWRPLFGGAHLAANLIFFAENTQTSLKTFRKKPLDLLTTLCGHLGCWANDLISLHKEQGHGDFHNLVPILQHEYGVTEDIAADHAVQIHNQEMRDFHMLYKRLDYYVGRQQDIGTYIFDLAMIVRGNLDWSFVDSERYGGKVGVV